MVGGGKTAGWLPDSCQAGLLHPPPRGWGALGLEKSPGHHPSQEHNDGCQEPPRVTPWRGGGGEGRLAESEVRGTERVEGAPCASASTAGAAGRGRGWRAAPRRRSCINKRVERRRRKKETSKMEESTHPQREVTNLTLPIIAATGGNGVSVSAAGNMESHTENRKPNPDRNT